MSGRETLHERIYRDLLGKLIAGEFIPGQRLPLRGLASELGTSLIPVRDALRKLESIGALEARSGQAMVVPDLSPEAIDDIREVRVALEGLAIDRICRINDAGDIDALGRLADQICQVTSRMAAPCRPGRICRRRTTPSRAC